MSISTRNPVSWQATVAKRNDWKFLLMALNPQRSATVRRMIRILEKMRRPVRYRINKAYRKRNIPGGEISNVGG
ncbi:hypothetical protein D3C74_452560 [compost metagenome]